MNCSENTTYGRKKISQKTYLERILLLLLGSLIIGLIVGSVTTWFICNNKTSRTKQIAASQEDLRQYGTLDGKVFDSDLKTNWFSGAEIKFIPLDVEMDKEVQEFIYCLSYGYNIDFAFVMGLIQQESTFRPNVVSKTNDYGLMQINIINHEGLTQKFGFDDYLDPYQNIRAGLYILRTLFEKYEDPVRVLMAYNLGETGAKHLWEQSIYETAYSNSVLEAVAAFNAELQGKGENSEE